MDFVVEKNAKEHCREYVEALEIERMKMLMFQRELPLSIELVSRAIESCRQELPVDHVVAGGRQGDKLREQQPESSEEAASDGGPVLEFIPIRKRLSASSSESEENDLDEVMKVCEDDGEEKSGTKSDWLRSVQLWNQTPDLPHASEDLPRDDLPVAKKVNTSSGDEASEPFIKEKSVKKSPGQADLSSAETEESQKSGGSKSKEDKEGRKQRRCWSQELHRRFLNSLQQLGGAHVATPKQIRELMKVDGLTNDEVKSHLQKYRLHTRRLTPPIHNNGSSQSTPQFVVVGGIWVSPSDHYPTMTTCPAVAVGRESNGVFTGAKSGVYTPMAAPPVPSSSHVWQPVSISNTPKPQVKSRSSEGHGSHGDGLARCISPSLSSNTRTTASPVF